MRLLPFSWYGGKAMMLKQLLPILESVPHQTFVDGCGGSGSVLLNKKPSPVEIYNDAFEDVVNFFRVLRACPDELIRGIELTPYSRMEFEESLGRENVDAVERARRFFVTARQVTMGLATTATAGRWCVAHNQSRRGMSLVVSRWLSATEGLFEVANRLKQVVVEKMDVLELIKRYDSPETLFYLDPPYPHSTRSGGKGYSLEWSDKKHRELLKLIRSCKGKVAISSYENQMYRDTLSSWGCAVLKGHSNTTHYYKEAEGARKECLWTNWNSEILKEAA